MLVHIQHLRFQSSLLSSPSSSLISKSPQPSPFTHIPFSAALLTSAKGRTKSCSTHTVHRVRIHLWLRLSTLGKSRRIIGCQHLGTSSAPQCPPSHPLTNWARAPFLVPALSAVAGRVCGSQLERCTVTCKHKSHASVVTRKRSIAVSTRSGPEVVELCSGS